jgi:hypothetical protein
MSSPRIRFLALAPLALATFVAAFLAGCTVPLGPGFQHLTRDINFSEVAASASAPAQPAVHLEISDSLKNVGNRDLVSLEVEVPSASSCDPAVMQQRSFAKGSFQPTQTQTAAFGYDLQRRRAGNCGISLVTPEGVYFTDFSALPRWQAPLGPFSKGNPRAVEERVRVTLPADYLVLAPGVAQHPRQQNGREGAGIQHEFHIRYDDFPLYLIAGRFRELRVTTRQQPVVFWTLEPLDRQTAEAAAARLSATAAVYQDFFGPVREKIARAPWPIHIVETSADLSPGWAPRGAPPATAQPTGTAVVPVAEHLIGDRPALGWAVSFPEGVLLDRRAVAEGLATEPVLRLAEYQLAATWFDWSVRPVARSQLLQGRTMGRFGIVLAAAARGGEPARRAEIARLIQAYDEDAPAETGRQTGARAAAETNPAQRAAWEADRAALFCVALEDMGGKEKLQHALREVLQALAGQEVDDDHLRTALEDGTGRTFAATFHEWLGRPGIPPEFRAMYAPAR